jgi:hypothetical protein
MRYSATFFLLFATLLLFASFPSTHAATVTSDAPQPAAARKILNLFDRLQGAQGDSSEGDRHVEFKLSEADINDYMRYALKTLPRPGLDSVTVRFFPKDYIATLARIDFDAVENWHPGTIPNVLRPFLKGKKSVSIDYRIHARDSHLTFTVEKARYDDLPLPAFFVEKVIQIIAAHQPEKYDTTNPVPLPFGLVAVSAGDHFVEGHN